MNKVNFLQSSFHSPDIYHRRYDLDLPNQTSGWKEQAKRGALTFLPFVSLYRPAGIVLSVGMGSVKTFSHLWNAKESSNWTNCSIEFVHGALAAFSIASTFFYFPLGLAVSTAFDVLDGAYNVYAYADDPRKMIEEMIQTLSSLIYLGVIVSAGLEIVLIFTLAQMTVSFLQAHGELSQGKYIEAAGKIAFGCIRLGQAKEIAGQIQQRNEIFTSFSLTNSNEKTTENNFVHFSDQSGELKKEFTESIAKAKKSVVCMTFSFSDKEILDLLLQKQKEGIAVTVVIDKNHIEFLSPYASQFKLLTRVQGEGRIHHKITVIDESTVWIGSANLSPDALTKQSNTMLRFESPKMAKALHEEMEVFAGLRQRSDTSPSQFNIEGQNVELLLFPHVPFEKENSPEKTLNEYGHKRILDLINQSKTSIKIAACVWTDPTITKAVLNAKARGVKVEVVVWKANESPDVYKAFKASKVPIQEKPHLPLMHNKWILVDDHTFFNGSANWSKSWFTRNDESGIILNDLSAAQKEAINSYWDRLSK